MNDLALLFSGVVVCGVGNGHIGGMISKNCYPKRYNFEFGHDGNSATLRGSALPDAAAAKAAEAWPIPTFRNAFADDDAMDHRQYPCRRTAVWPVVTGANSGLGLQTATALAAAGAQVIMACRNPGQGLLPLWPRSSSRRPAQRCELMTPCDLADLASVRSVRRRVLREAVRAPGSADQQRRCHGAAVLARTKDGFEMQIGTNHFGHFALTGLAVRQAAGRQSAARRQPCQHGAQLDAGPQFR